MSDNSDQQFLDMAMLAGAEQSTEPGSASTTKREKQTYTLCGLEDDPTFKIPKARIKHQFIGGKEASFLFWHPLRSVKPPKGKSLGELEASKTPVPVTIETPNGALVAATWHGAHKDGLTCTLSTVWPLSEAWIEHKTGQKPKRQKTSKSDGVAKVPAEFSAGAPKPFAVLYASERNLPPAPTPADLARFLRKIEGFVAPANATDTVVLLSPVLTEVYTKWCEVDTDEVRAMGRGSKVMGSDFAPDALDLALIKHRVVPARDVAVVLGYENAVVNDKFPHIAVGDSSWAERIAAAAASPARSTTTTEADSSSDNEHSAPDVAAPAAQEVAAPAAQEVVDLTLDSDQSDDSAQSAPAPAPRAAKKRKRPEHVEYIDLDD